MNDRWLDGPRFVAWLKEAAPESYALARRDNGYGDSLGRRITDWKKGVAVDVYTADRYLTNLGLHIQLIDDDIYRESPHARPKVVA